MTSSTIAIIHPITGQVHSEPKKSVNTKSKTLCVQEILVDVTTKTSMTAAKQVSKIPSK